MKVLTLHQPWASLIAVGVKTIETRGQRAPASVIGQRIAIHAAAREPSLDDLRLLGEPLRHGKGASPTVAGRAVPLGAIVATAVVAVSVPVVDYMLERADVRARVELIEETLLLRIPGERPATYISDQLPYGDFRPGRWAWFLEDVQPLAEPVPFKGGQGWSKSWDPT